MHITFARICVYTTNNREEVPAFSVEEDITRHGLHDVVRHPEAAIEAREERPPFRIPKRSDTVILFEDPPGARKDSK